MQLQASKERRPSNSSATLPYGSAVSLYPLSQAYHNSNNRWLQGDIVVPELGQILNRGIRSVSINSDQLDINKFGISYRQNN